MLRVISRPSQSKNHGYTPFPTTIATITHWAAKLMQKSNQTPPKAKLTQSAPLTLNAISLSKYSVIPGSIFSSEAENGSMVTKERDSGFLSQHQSSSSESSMKSQTMRKELMSKQRSVWHLPPFYDLENLHGIHHGPPNITNSISLVHTSNSIPMTR
jgi:hypothetical protein